MMASPIYVPEITKNLMSVPKLTADNNFIGEFDANCCFVKNKQTWKTLLRGRLKEGLYKVSNSSPRSNKYSCTYMHVNESWQKKVGHLNNKFLDKVLKHCNANTSSSDQFQFYEACQFGKRHMLPFKSYSSHAHEPLGPRVNSH